MYLGDFLQNKIVYLPFNTFAANGASCTVTDLAATDVHIHKNGGLTQRNNAAGITVSINFDGITGNHLIAIDTSDNTVAGFYTPGSDYDVRLEGITVDGKTLNVWLGKFSIANRSAITHSLHEWHVAKTGVDTNGGHSFEDALLTIAAAVTAAAAGDTIFVWPGTYDETVDASAKSLNFKGSSRYSSRVEYTGNSFALKIGTGCTIKSMTLKSNSAINTNCQGLKCSTYSNIQVEDCDIYGSWDGLAAAICTDLTFINCNIYSKDDGATFNGSKGILAVNCHFYTDGSYGMDGRACFLGYNSSGILVNCSFNVNIDTANINFAGIESSGGIGSSTAHWVIDNCVINLVGTANATGLPRGINCAVAKSLIKVNNTVIYTSSLNAGYDLCQSSTAKLLVSNSAYDTTKVSGTVIQGDSGFEDAINTQADLALSDINLDHLIKVAKDTSWGTTVMKESVIDLMTSKDTNQTFDRATDSKEAIRDKLPINLEDLAVVDTSGIVSANIVSSNDINLTAKQKADVNIEVDSALNTDIPSSTAGSINERIKTLDDNYTDTRAGYLDKAIGTAETNVRGSDNDTLKTLSDQIDIVGSGGGVPSLGD